MTHKEVIGDATLYLDEARMLTRSQRYRLRKKGVAVPFVPQRTDHLHTPEANEKRKRFGSENYQWLGDDVPPKVGRKRALRAFPEIGPCVRCGEPKAERHHKDENPSNNSPSNIEALCRPCHIEVHRELRCRKK